MKYFSVVSYFFMLSISSCLISCSVPQSKHEEASTEQQSMHTAYDDSTLHNNVLPVLMAYNRLIAPAGRVISYGDPGLENHSLDVQLIPQTPLLAIEDRYGVAVLDTAQHKLVARWTYTDDARYKGAMSTYSGLKVAQEAGTTHLYWSAANPRISSRTCWMRCTRAGSCNSSRRSHLPPSTRR
jgi:hypothetical protein